MILPLLLALSHLAAPDDFATLRRAWGLAPADVARPGLWKAKPRRGEAAEVLVRVDTTAKGAVLRSEWSAEAGKREVDLPEDRFWSILDGFSGGQEWLETDPDALPAGIFEPPASSLAQGFRCPTCSPVLVAATWSPHGGTRLLVGRSTLPKPPTRFQVQPKVTEEGILSLARQRSLGVEGRNPCKDGSGSCRLDLVGGTGERWRLSRRSGSAPWRLDEASFPASAWWNPDWSWDSLRTDSPREFGLVLKNWLDAELDVVGARLIRPLEPILSSGAAEWNARAVPDLAIGPAVERLVPLASPPASLTLCEGKRLRVSIDAFGRRTVAFSEDAP